MRNLYGRLRELLAQGFYPENLLKVARLAEEASWQADYPLGLYVLSQLLVSLADEWPEQGIETVRAEEMARTMEPPITAFLTAGAAGLSLEKEVSYLNDIVRASLHWRSG